MRAAFKSVDETKAASEPSELVAGLFLHEVEAHGDERETTHKVEAAHDVLLRAPRVEAGAEPRHVVAEPDRRQRDEAEICGDWSSLEMGKNHRCFGSVRF